MNDFIWVLVGVIWLYAAFVWWEIGKEPWMAALSAAVGVMSIISGLFW